MYGQNVVITMENVDGVLYAAEKYDLGSLKEKCDSFLSNECEKSGNALRAFEIAQKYSLVDLSKISLELVGQNAKEYFTSTEFTELARETIQALLGYDDIDMPEIEIYRAALRWAEAECNRKSLCKCDFHFRQVIGNMLYSIRFPLIDGDLFCKDISDRNVLTPEEKNDIFKHYVAKEPPPKTCFNSKPRINCSFVRVVRFNNHSSSPGWTMGGSTTDALSFTLEKSAYLKGILMYGSITGNCTYSYTLELLKNSESLTSVQSQIETNGTNKIYELCFDQHIRIENDTRYTVCLTASGSDTFNGDSGEVVRKYDKNKITFEHSDLSTNSTSVKKGQIPGLLLSCSKP